MTLLWARRPSWMRSIRFRLGVLASTLLLSIATVVVAGIYVVLAHNVQDEPVTETFQAIEGIRRDDGTFKPLRRIEVAEVADIEAAVNAETLASLRAYSVYALGGLFVTSLAVGWLLAARALRPVRDIAATAEDVRAGDLSRRVALHRDDELGSLAEQIDAMLAHLDELFTSQRQFVDDASHELRTPLAVIRTNVDAVLARPDLPEQERHRAVAVVDRAVDRMTRLVEDMRAADRAGARLGVRTAVNLAAVVHEEVEEFGTLAADREIELAVDLDHDVVVPADPDNVRRMIDNLLSNAVRLAPRGSVVDARVGRSPAEPWAYVAVRDRGPGIAPEDQRRVFDRFWRSDPAGLEQEEGGHAGLGLSIVREMARAHGGLVRVHSQLGAGSVFVVWLPTAGPGDSGEPPPGSPLSCTGVE
jgi:signal transduction histidine kinase